MKFDITRLPVFQGVMGFLAILLIITFVFAFRAVEEDEKLVMRISPTPMQGGITPMATPGGLPQKLVDRGRQLAESNACLACHSISGEVLTGPTWLNLFGKTETLEDGSQVVVDEEYIRESIRNPAAKVVKGFPAVMPSFSALSDQDIDAIIAFIKSLSEAEGASTSQ